MTSNVDLDANFKLTKPNEPKPAISRPWVFKSYTFCRKNKRLVRA